MQKRAGNAQAGGSHRHADYRFRSVRTPGSGTAGTTGKTGRTSSFNNSVMMRRILLLQVLAILVSAILTTFFYSLTSNIVFTRLSTNEYKNKAAYLAEKSVDYFTGTISAINYEGVIDSAPDLLGATIGILFYDRKGYLKTSAATSYDSQTLSEIKTLMENNQQLILQNGSVATHVYLGKEKTDTLLVGYPIAWNNPHSKTVTAVGFVYLLRSFSDIRAGHASLNFALIFASCLTFLLMAAPTVIAVSRLLKPLRQVKNVALAMASGNFTQRADATQPGEFGELATAINDLAAALDRSITALLVERNRLQQILDGISEGILAVDDKLRITHLNPALRQLFSGLSNQAGDTENLDKEYGKSETAEEPFIATEHGLLESPYGLEDDFRKAIEGRQTVSRTFSVGDRTVLVAVSPLIGGRETVIGAVGLFRDITATEKLEQTRRDYVANVSHELRTPLTALRGLIEPLSDGLVSEESDRNRYYGIIYNETLRLSRLIDDMLELSRLQAGQLKMKFSVFDLGEVIDNLHEKFTPIVVAQGVTLRFPSSEQLPLTYGNADRTEQILVILVDNALKFTPRGGEVSVRVYDTDTRLEVSVQDTGPGIKAEDIQHIFERFYKADKSRGRSGTGLGLSIASEIIRAMHEEIWVESKPGHGARFTFTLRKADAAAEADGNLG